MYCELLQYTVYHMLWISVNICRNYSEIKQVSVFLEHGVYIQDAMCVCLLAYNSEMGNAIVSKFLG